jgi:NADH-quinone oxidoreductase subunit E
MNTAKDKIVVVEDILLDYKEAGRDKLIPILQKVQEHHGYLSKESVTKISKHLNLPVSKIYGVATFYNQFRFKPKGKYHILVCRGTACHVKGSLDVLGTLINMLNIEPGQTSRDELFSLEVVACIGACGLAPLICINEEFHGNVNSDKIEALIENIRKEEN